MKRFVLRKHRSDNAFNIFNFVIGGIITIQSFIFLTFHSKSNLLWHLIHNKIIIKKIDIKKLLILPIMIEHVHPRITENKDWAAFLFILCFAIIAITKSVYENRLANLWIYYFQTNITRCIVTEVTWRAAYHFFFVQLLSLAFYSIHSTFLIHPRQIWFFTFKL
jgi:hypothetical protein